MRRKEAPTLRKPWRGVVPCKRTLEARSIDGVTRVKEGTGGAAAAVCAVGGPSDQSPLRGVIPPQEPTGDELEVAPAATGVRSGHDGLAAEYERVPFAGVR